MKNEKVEIVEVGARDGLQNEKEIISTKDKLQLIQRCMDAGAKRIEVASFVNPKRVPQMADAEEILKEVPDRPDVTYIGLVLNERGAERALATRADELGAVAVASDGFGVRNQRQTSLESVDVAGEIVEIARAEGRSAQVTVSTAFGCPFDGEVSEDHVVEICRRLAGYNPREIALADTIGVAGPGQVFSLFSKVKDVVGDIPLRAHFHNTRNTGLANAWAAWTAGVRVLDSSLGGLGGCPFAPNATGNIATEDLVFMLKRSGIDTGLDLDQLIDTASWFADSVMKRDLPAMTSRAGNFPMATAS